MRNDKNPNRKVYPKLFAKKTQSIFNSASCPAATFNVHFSAKISYLNPNPNP